MAHLADKAHLVDNAHIVDKVDVDKHTLARVNSALLIGLIGGGLAICMLGAVIYDLRGLLSIW
jgi:hypothetical protein